MIAKAPTTQTPVWFWDIKLWSQFIVFSTNSITQPQAAKIKSIQIVEAISLERGVLLAMRTTPNRSGELSST